MFYIFHWLFRSLWLWGCGSRQTCAQQQPSLSSLCPALSPSVFPSLHLCLFITLSLFSSFPTGMVLSFLPLSVSRYGFCLLFITLNPFVSLIDQSFTTINRWISQTVWIPGPIFHDIDSLCIHVCVYMSFKVCTGQRSMLIIVL